MNASASVPPPLPRNATAASADEIRFNTTRWDLYWSLNHRLLLGRGSLIMLLVIWAWCSFDTAQEFLESDSSTVFKIVAVGIGAFFWGFLLVAIQFVVAAFMILFMRTEGFVCEHTLRLRPDGLEEETDVNRSLQKYTVVEGMKQMWGFWVVRASGGNAFIFRPPGLLSGDPVAFAAKLESRLRTEARERIPAIR